MLCCRGDGHKLGDMANETPWYELDTSGEIWWCKTHDRVATHILHRIGGSTEHVCEPGLPGIMLPCGVHGVYRTDVVPN